MEAVDLHPGQFTAPAILDHVFFCFSLSTVGGWTLRRIFIVARKSTRSASFRHGRQRASPRVYEIVVVLLELDAGIEEMTM